MFLRQRRDLAMPVLELELAAFAAEFVWISWRRLRRSSTSGRTLCKRSPVSKDHDVVADGLGSRGIEFFDTWSMVGCPRPELALADRS